MAIPLLVGLGSVVGGWIFQGSKFIGKVVVFGSFLSMMTAFLVFIVGFLGTIYSKIQGAIDGLGITYGGLLGCVVNALALDDFMTSFLSIVVTGSIFWGVTVSYILTFAFGKTTYKTFLRLL